MKFRPNFQSIVKTIWPQCLWKKFFLSRRYRPDGLIARFYSTWIMYRRWIFIHFLWSLPRISDAWLWNYEKYRKYLHYIYGISSIFMAQYLQNIIWYMDFLIMTRVMAHFAHLHTPLFLPYWINILYFFLWLRSRLN